MNIHSLITVCTKRDAHNWALIAPAIIKYIKAENYIIIVPVDDIQIFSRISPENFKIKNENLYLEFGIRKKISEKLGHDQSKFGWYLQQLLKLEASLSVPENKIGLIWDSDTLPIRPIKFSNTLIEIFTSSEYNKPYFDSIYSLLGIRKQVDYSFISQCMPFYGRWISSLKTTIECRHQNTWQNAIVDTSCQPHCSGFSEYELIGSYAVSFYPDQIGVKRRPQKWLRHGKSYFGSIKNVYALKFILKFFYYYIAFESWEPAFSRYKRFLAMSLRKNKNK